MRLRASRYWGHDVVLTYLVSYQKGFAIKEAIGASPILSAPVSSFKQSRERAQIAGFGQHWLLTALVPLQ